MSQRALIILDELKPPALCKAKADRLISAREEWGRVWLDQDCYA